MDPFTEIASLLAPIDPHASATRILERVVDRNGASGGTVLAIHGMEPRPYASWGLSLDDMVDVQPLWLRHEGWLFAGRPIEHEAAVILPLMEGPALLGVLYLKDPKNYDAAATAAWVLALTVSLRAAIYFEGSRVAYPEHAPSHRDRLLRALNEKDWNIAAVARQLGVTRRTIYLRMDRFGIERQRIPKTFRVKKAG